MKKLVMSMIMVLGIVGLLSAQQSSQSDAQMRDAGWEKIGQTTLNLSTDYGIFDWDRDREETINANDKFSQIKFKAKDHKVSLTNVEVKYDDGKKEALKVGNVLEANKESKPLKLNTTADLDEVTFSFQKDDSAPEDKVVVEIWGLKADRSSGMGRTGTGVDVDVDVDTTNRIRR
jgi:hypothetical protein